MQEQFRAKWLLLEKVFQDNSELLNQIVEIEKDRIVDNLSRSEEHDSYIRCHFLFNEVLQYFHNRDDAIAIAELLTNGNFFESSFHEVRVTRTDGA